MLAFGPDGYLYVGMGDGGGAGDPGNRAQNVNALLGKILRINVNDTTAGSYAIPRAIRTSAGPVATKSGRSGCATRGASRSTRATGDLWIGDVGQSRYEEIDRSAKAPDAGRGGTTAGGSSRAATATARRRAVHAGKTMPSSSTRLEGCSVTGGYVYRGADVCRPEGRLPNR